MTNPTFSLGGDLEINRLGYGAMRITGDGVWGPPKDKPEAIKVLKRAVELGVNFIDTADSYGPFVSEELIAEALHPYTEDLVIATKAGLTRQGPNKWTPNARPDYLEMELKGSLGRLKLERIDLYQLHRFDPKVPADEFLGKLAELQEEGLIRHLGLSEVSVEQIQRAQEHFDVVSIQNKYNLSDRESEGQLAWCQGRGIAFIPWYPLSAGALDDAGLANVSRQQGKSPYQIALAWLLAKTDNMLPIPGTSSVKHLEENMRAAEIELSEEQVDLLDGVTA